jgi:hypothetical protein
MFLDDNFARALTADIHGKQRTAPSLAHAWSALGVQDIGGAVDKVLAAPTAADAKRLAQTKLPTPGWMRTRDEARKGLLRAKFAEPFMQNLLLRASPVLLRAKGLDWLQAEVKAAAAPATSDPIDTTEGWGAPPKVGGPSGSASVVAPAVPAPPRVVSEDGPKVDDAGMGGIWVTYPGAAPILMAPLVAVEDESTLLGVGGNQTVSEARAALLAGFSLKKKVEQDCPCCGKRSVADARGITGTDGKCLVTLCRAFVDRLNVSTLGFFAVHIERLWPADGGPWLSTNKEGALGLSRFGINVHNTSRTWTQLRYRGLLQERPKALDETSYQGSAFWRPTKLGILFAAGRVSIPNKVTTFDNALAIGPWMNGAAEEWNMATIRDLKNFDYGAFMRGEG